MNRLTTFDISEYLDSNEMIAEYLSQVLKDGDTNELLEAIGNIAKAKGGFNSDESLFKLVYLAYKDIAKKWEKSISNWGEIISQFSIIFEDRLNVL